MVKDVRTTVPTQQIPAEDRPWKSNIILDISETLQSLDLIQNHTVMCPCSALATSRRRRKGMIVAFILAESFLI